MTRAYRPYPDAVEIEVDGQRLRVTANGGESVFVQTGDPVTVRGIQYEGNLHVRLHEGRWTSHYDIPGNTYSFKAKRVDRPFQDVTPAANKSVEALMVRAAEAFAERHPGLLPKGEAANVSNDLGRVEERLAKLREEMETALVERRRLLGRLAELEPDAPAPTPGM